VVQTSRSCSRRKYQRLTLLTPLHAHVRLTCGCDTPMLMLLFYANARRLRKRTESRRSRLEDSERCKWRRSRTVESKADEEESKTRGKRLSDEADIDSVDSVICAWGTHMRMWFFHAHASLPCSGGSGSCGFFYMNARRLRERTESRR